MANPILLYDSLDEFLLNFDNNLKSFQKIYKNSNLDDFLDEYELKINKRLNYFNTAAGQFQMSYSDSEMKTEHNPHKEKLALKAINRFIQNKRKISTSGLSGDKNYTNQIRPVQWKGSPTELTALIKSLKESSKLDNSISEKQIVERFEQFFKFPLKGYDQTKSKIRQRTIELTPFIDKLKKNLELWINKKDD